MRNKEQVRERLNYINICSRKNIFDDYEDDLILDSIQYIKDAIKDIDNLLDDK